VGGLKKASDTMKSILVEKKRKEEEKILKRNTFLF